MNETELMKKLDPDKLPVHVAVIMDGNGRWAQKHKVKRLMGHKSGVAATRRTIEMAYDAGIKYLTVYAFSTENWNRSAMEVNYLLKLIMDSLLKEIDELLEKKINIHFLGSKEHLEQDYYTKAMATCKRSWHHDKMYLNIAMNYGGRKELIEGVKIIAQNVQAGIISPDDIDETMLANALYTAGIPDPDLVIRTSGEQRLSNFLIWQSAYSELWFINTLWPDFTKAEFVQALLDYQARKRRFGGR
ncbi:MAG: isoprenyl transferase [Candidatus Cloacimonetes bacterium]|nr:isoprenyl transferase [Candidatus Cloacimonadota bacterium]